MRSRRKGSHITLMCSQVRGASGQHGHREVKYHEELQVIECGHFRVFSSMSGVLTPVYSCTFWALLFNPTNLPPKYFSNLYFAVCAKILTDSKSKVRLDSVFTLPYPLADLKLLITVSFLTHPFFYNTLTLVFLLTPHAFFPARPFCTHSMSLMAAISLTAFYVPSISKPKPIPHGAV